MRIEVAVAFQYRRPHDLKKKRCRDLSTYSSQMCKCIVITLNKVCIRNYPCALAILARVQITAYISSVWHTEC